MPLTPGEPPGRANRKACAYQAGIGRLRAEGCSFVQLRQALAVKLAVTNSGAIEPVARWPANALSRANPIDPRRAAEPQSRRAAESLC